jgi:hypothetical protein
MIGSRPASGFRTLFQILTSLFFCDLCALFRLFQFPGAALKFSHPTIFCAFCAFLRLFSSYFIAFGLSPGFVTFSAEDPSCSR